MAIYQEDDFMGRVNYAVKVISERRPTTRGFDTCFEMNDGEVVCSALTRRAKKNARLAENLPRYINETSIVDRFPGENLVDVALKLRTERAAAFKVWLAGLSG